MQAVFGTIVVILKRSGNCPGQGEQLSLGNKLEVPEAAAWKLKSTLIRLKFPAEKRDLMSACLPVDACWALWSATVDWDRVEDDGSSMDEASFVAFLACW